MYCFVKAKLYVANTILRNEILIYNVNNYGLILWNLNKILIPVIASSGLTSGIQARDHIKHQGLEHRRKLSSKLIF